MVEQVVEGNADRRRQVLPDLELLGDIQVRVGVAGTKELVASLATEPSRIVEHLALLAEAGRRSVPACVEVGRRSAALVRRRLSYELRANIAAVVKLARLDIGIDDRERQSRSVEHIAGDHPAAEYHVGTPLEQ